jgi:hypothetical protein
MALAFSTKSAAAESAEHVQKFDRLLDDGSRQVMSSLKQTSLLSKLVLMPHDLSKFVNLVLLGDITVSTTAQPPDIYESYLEYLSILVRSPNCSHGPILIAFRRWKWNAGL